MPTHDTIVAQIGISFQVDEDVPPPNTLIHDALVALRAIEVRAPSVELAELYVDTLRRALEDAGNAKRAG